VRCRRAGKDSGREDPHASLHLEPSVMKTTYYPQDDILEIHFSDKPSLAKSPRTGTSISVTRLMAPLWKSSSSTR
jgi:hypothetical protein